MSLPFNTSKKAESRVSNPLPAPDTCRYCSGEVRIARNREVYQRDFGDWPWIYICNGCRAYVGMHPGTAIPLGTLADRETREARKACKPAFNALWQGRQAFLSRKGAYQTLADALGIPVSECHFAWFDVDACREAQRICISIMKDRRQRRP